MDKQRLVRITDQHEILALQAGQGALDVPRLVSGTRLGGVERAHWADADELRKRRASQSKSTGEQT